MVLEYANWFTLLKMRTERQSIPSFIQNMLLLTIYSKFTHNLKYFEYDVPTRLYYHIHTKAHSDEIIRPANVMLLKPLTWNCRRSQILIAPSSPPESMKGSFLFQCITLTSLSCASLAVSLLALPGAERASQIRIVLSTEQDAKTCWVHTNTLKPNQ